jgi:hypothetical protein
VVTDGSTLPFSILEYCPCGKPEAAQISFWEKSYANTESKKTLRLRRKKTTQS